MDRNVCSHNHYCRNVPSLPISVCANGNVDKLENKENELKFALINHFFLLQMYIYEEPFVSVKAIFCRLKSFVSFKSHVSFKVI